MEENFSDPNWLAYIADLVREKENNALIRLDVVLTESEMLMLEECLTQCKKLIQQHHKEKTLVQLYEGKQGTTCVDRRELETLLSNVQQIIHYSNLQLIRRENYNRGLNINA